MQEIESLPADHEAPHHGGIIRRWRSSFTLFSLLALGWVLYELTTQPALGAVAVCIKFGWEDFRAAIWLRRVDPRRLRGRACFWLYLSSGLAKTAVIAGLMSFAFACVSPRGPAAQGPRWAATIEMFAWTGLTMLCGLGSATLSLAYAAALSRWGRFKLWLSRDIHRARHGNEWPPYGPIIVENNRLGILLLGALIIILIPLFLFYLVFILSLARGNHSASLVLGFGGIFIVPPVLMLICRDRARRWLIASHPCECWEEDGASSPDAGRVLDVFGNLLDRQW